jgi:hypothetical protein
LGQYTIYERVVGYAVALSEGGVEMERRMSTLERIRDGSFAHSGSWSRGFPMAALTMLLCVGGCFSVAPPYELDLDSTFLADRYFPSRQRALPIDSTGAVVFRAREDEERPVRIEEPLRSIYARWSTGLQLGRDTPLGGANRFQTYATLWGYELALANTLYSTGFSDLTPESLERILSRVSESHEGRLRIDVFLMIDERHSDAFQSTRIAGRGASKIRLRTDTGFEAVPADVRDSPPRILRAGPGEPGVLGRITTLLFDRKAEDTELLEKASEIEVRIDTQAPSHSVLVFRWELAS